jgi:hypothetical protein
MAPRVWGVRHLVIALCSLTACCGAYFINAQTRLPDKESSRVEDIQIGMDRDKVLAALAGRYDLKQEDLGEGNLDGWVVVDKKGSPESYEIMFEDKKVGAIWFHEMPYLKGDAVELARDLFTKLCFQAKRPIGQTVAADTFSTKQITVPVTLLRVPGTNTETERIAFETDNFDYVVEVVLPVRGEPHVSVARVKNKNVQ